MYKKDKARSGLGTEKLRNRFLRLLSSESSQASANSEENTAQEFSGTMMKEVANAMLEAEFRKSQAVMERERHPFVF